MMVTSMSRNLMATSPCQLPACTVENRPEPILSPSLENGYESNANVVDGEPELLIGDGPLPDRHLSPRAPGAQAVSLNRCCRVLTSYGRDQTHW